jgi:hypothetical protein
VSPGTSVMRLPPIYQHICPLVRVGNPLAWPGNRYLSR